MYTSLLKYKDAFLLAIIDNCCNGFTVCALSFLEKIYRKLVCINFLFCSKSRIISYKKGSCIIDGGTATFFSNYQTESDHNRNF